MLEAWIGPFDVFIDLIGAKASMAVRSDAEGESEPPAAPEPEPERPHKYWTPGAWKLVEMMRGN